VRVHTLERLAAWDRVLCLRFNRASDLAFIRVVLIAASQLGNGVFWYALIAALAVWGDGARASAVVVHMVGVGVVCTLMYKWLKKGTSRLRPYMSQPGITLCAVPLDRYSFPSGHTLHATAFSLVALAYYPALGWLLIPFSLLVALSRVVLGLHYPSDVIAGAVLGAAIALLSFAVPF
jgi:undecaprenyl-diphosphatase